MIYLRGSPPSVKALPRQNCGRNLTLILGLIAAIILSLFAIQVARDNRHRIHTINRTRPRRAE